MIERAQITGLLLAGGRGSRLGGVDKGLLPYQGQTLAQHALQRLAPQVGPLMISANRHLAQYQALGLPVWPDAQDAVRITFDGPLAGMLAGLELASTPWLATVPCDTPHFPTDLVARLAEAAAREQAELAMAATRSTDGQLRPQPVFCLMQTRLASRLRAGLAAGQRKIEQWSAQQRRVLVPFDDGSAFFNVNTAEDLAALNQAG